MSEAILKLEGIARDFFDGKQQRRVLKKTDLEIFPGEFTIIAGPSGSGKTTLMTIMGLVLQPSEGNIYIGDKKVATHSDTELANLRMRNFGFVFQQAELIPALSVLENLLIAAGVQGGTIQGSLKEKVLTLIESFGLKEYTYVKSQKLSTGQKQRIAIGRALVNDPKVLLCDEPTSALDSESSTIVLDTLKRLSKDGSRGVVMVTHDPRVFPYADRLIKLEDGGITYDSRGEGVTQWNHKEYRDILLSLLKNYSGRDKKVVIASNEPQVNDVAIYKDDYSAAADHNDSWMHDALV